MVTYTIVWGFLIIIIVEYVPKPCSNYEGLYITSPTWGFSSFRDPDSLSHAEDLSP